MIQEYEYTLIERSDRVAFINEVNARIREGWSLWGDTVVLMDPASPLEKMVYAQAMTRRANDDDAAAYRMVERVSELPFELLPIIE